MSLSGPQVAAAAHGAGFAGEALVTIVAIAQRESGWNPDAVGDVALEDATWGPSVGLYQVRTLKADTGSGGDRDITALLPGGHGDPVRQSAAAWSISGGGVNFTPWSTYAGLSSGAIDAARAAVGAIGSAAPLPSTGAGGGATATTVSLTSSIGDLMDQALGRFLGLPDGETVSEFMVELAIRGLELLGGAVVFGVGLIMFLEVIGHNPSRGASRAAGMVRGTIRNARRAAELGALL